MKTSMNITLEIKRRLLYRIHANKIVKFIQIDCDVEIHMIEKNKKVITSLNITLHMKSRILCRIDTDKIVKFNPNSINIHCPIHRRKKNANFCDFLCVCIFYICDFLYRGWNPVMRLR